jgi:hypothetical protein
MPSTFADSHIHRRRLAPYRARSNRKAPIMGPLEDYLSAIFGDSCRELALHPRWALIFAKRVIIFSCSRAEAGSAAGDPCSGRIHYGPPAVAFINFFCREESQHDLDAGSKINSRGPKQFSKTPANDQNKKKICIRRNRPSRVSLCWISTWELASGLMIFEIN